MGESLCHFSLCVSNGKASLLEDGFLPVPEHVGGVAGHGLHTIEVLVIFFPGWPFHLGQALKESALSSECCPVLSTRAASPLFAEMSWCLTQLGALRGHKISTRPVGIANNLAIM